MRDDRLDCLPKRIYQVSGTGSSSILASTLAVLSSTSLGIFCRSSIATSRCLSTILLNMNCLLFPFFLNANLSSASFRAETADWQRKFKMANRSEFSWSVVEPYKSNDLASDSVDKKRIAKAEKEAEERASKWKRDKRNVWKSVGTEPKRPATWELGNCPKSSRVPPMQPKEYRG